MTDQRSSYGELAVILGSLDRIVRATRRARQLSQRAAAKKIGIAHSTISRLESGHDISLLNVVMVLEWLLRDPSTSSTSPHQTQENQK